VNEAASQPKRVDTHPDPKKLAELHEAKDGAGRERAEWLYRPKAKRERRGYALCLSGGGYRAMLFHLGSLTRLNELGVLARMDTITSVSGGSLMSGFLTLVPDWPEHGVIPHWQQRVIDPVRKLARHNIRTPAVLKSLWRLPPLEKDTELLESRYSKCVQGRLNELGPPLPRLVFCATDLAFGVNWQSERGFVGDYETGYCTDSGWTVARAVAASSAFPPVFQPLRPGIDPGRLSWGKYNQPDRDELIRGLGLSDGGVYDNMGLEPVWKSHKLLLVSDGGGTFDPRPDRGLLSRFGRYISVVEDQAEAVRKRWLIAGYLDKELEGTYWGIGSSPSSYDPKRKIYDKQLTAHLIAKVRTDLDAFREGEQEVLVNHGYLLADAAIAKYAPGLATAKAACAPPYEKLLDPQEARNALKHSSRRTLCGRW
jgi:NTE family protein